MSVLFFFQAEDGIRDLVRSRGLGDVYKRQVQLHVAGMAVIGRVVVVEHRVLDVDHRAAEGIDLSLIHI